MAPQTALLAALGIATAPLASASVSKVAASAAGDGVVTKVVKLLEQMKTQVEAEAEEDEEVHKKMQCWCKTGETEKTAAIKAAKSKLVELAAFIEEGTATVARLGTEIEGLKESIADGQESLKEATGIREGEREDFAAEEADMKETLGALKEAVEVLSKVQLVQKSKGGAEADSRIPAESLAQVRKIVQRIPRSNSRLYGEVIQKDLWAMLGDFPSPAGAASHRRTVTGLSQQPMGGAAATSYSSQSSTIFGILQTMEETTTKNLKAAQKAETMAEVAFQRLRAAKESEIDAATKSVEEKTAYMAETDQKVAQAKEDVEQTTETLAADEKYLADLKVTCATAEKDYGERVTTRIDEVAAIQDAITILTEDEARDTFSKTFALLQVSSRSASSSKVAVAQKRARARAASSLFAAAQRRNALESSELTGLAVAAQLDSFGKVKAMMDTMVTELKKQQELEVEKHDGCVANLDQNGDDIMHKEAEEKDFNTDISNMEGAISMLDKEIKDLKVEVADTQVDLKRASEQRQTENKEFQQVISDQKATVTVVKKALDRLAEFYDLVQVTKKGKTAFLQKGRKSTQEPAGPPPPEAYKQSGAAGKSYTKNQGSTGVMQMLEKLIQDAEQAQAEAKAAEQDAQAAYEELVANTNAMLEAAETSISEKSETKASTESDKLLAESDLKNTQQALEDLDGQKQALHMSCDYLVKNFNVRQKARQEEIEAVQQAKAILSGANFGF